MNAAHFFMINVPGQNCQTFSQQSNMFPPPLIVIIMYNVNSKGIYYRLAFKLLSGVVKKKSIGRHFHKILPAKFISFPLCGLSISLTSFLLLFGSSCRLLFALLRRGGGGELLLWNGGYLLGSGGRLLFLLGGRRGNDG